MEQLVRNEPPESESSGFLPASDIDTGVIPMRPSGRGMLQVAVDETRRSAALKAPVKARVEELDFYYGQLKALKNLNMHIREKQGTASSSASLGQAAVARPRSCAASIACTT